MSYKPKPISTSGIKLPPYLLELMEHLAENAHDNWAMQHIADGWTYGPKRDDAALKHPDLVAYNDLPELEREYDRKIAGETIKAIIALGYRIKKA